MWKLLQETAGDFEDPQSRGHKLLVSQSEISGLLS